jgi:hypothetical protein
VGHQPVGAENARPARQDGRRDRTHFFELRLDELPKLQLDKREVIEGG